MFAVNIHIYIYICSGPMMLHECRCVVLVCVWVCVFVMCAVLILCFFVFVFSYLIYIYIYIYIYQRHVKKTCLATIAVFPILFTRRLLVSLVRGFIRRFLFQSCTRLEWTHQSNFKHWNKNLIPRRWSKCGGIGSSENALNTFFKLWRWYILAPPMY